MGEVQRSLSFSAATEHSSISVGATMIRHNTAIKALIKSMV